MPAYYTQPVKTSRAFTRKDASVRGKTSKLSAHWQILSNLTQKARLQDGQCHGARIAAICLENSGSVRCTADRNFGRFKDLKTRNPLV